MNGARISLEKMANTHRRYNNIDKLLIDGIEAEDPDIIKGKILNYYKNCAMKQKVEAQIGWPRFGKLSESDREWLQRCFTEEVLMTLRKRRR